MQRAYGELQKGKRGADVPLATSKPDLQATKKQRSLQVWVSVLSRKGTRKFK